jgi:uncharacterized damage-inducible protein DinB
LLYCFIADTIWLKAFKQIRDSNILKNPIIDKERKWGEKQFDDLDNFIENRKMLDKLIIDFVEELKDEDLGKSIVRIARNGDKTEKLFWKSIIHMFNHQTHHRGQISQILDEMKIRNDYSNMIRFDLYYPVL